MVPNPSIDFFDRQFRHQAAAGDTLLNPFEQAALPHLRGRVLDLGCGMGNLAVAAARCGCKVRALDGSRSAIEHLRRVARAEPLTIAVPPAATWSRICASSRFAAGQSKNISRPIETIASNSPAIG